MEKKFAIITDSTADLGKDLRNKYDIDYACMTISVEGKEYQASLDWEEYSLQEFYDWMRKGIRVYTTQVPNDNFKKKFVPYLENGMDVLYIACSSALSASYKASLVIKEELSSLYPERKIICVDSLISSMGEGQIAIEASKMRDAGKTMEEIVAWIEEHRNEYHQLATVEDLGYLKRAGRVKATKAFFGNLFGIKPIIMSDAKGQNYAYKKAKGRKGAYTEIIATIRDEIVNAEAQYISITHADCLSDAEELKERILKEIPCKGVYINPIGPIVGASVGPGTLGIYYYGKEVTIIEE